MAKDKTLWGGRLPGGVIHHSRDSTTPSHSTCRLFEADVRASIAHCNALVSAGVLRVRRRRYKKRTTHNTRARAGRATTLMQGNPKCHSFIEARLVGWWETRDESYTPGGAATIM